MPKRDNGKTKQEEKKKHWEAVKTMKNFRGVLCTVPETFGFVDLAKQIDITVKRLRNSSSIRMTVKETIPMFDALGDASLFLVQTIESLAQALKYEQFKTPRVFEEMKKTHTMDKTLEERLNMVRHTIGLSAESATESGPH